jgi:starvation-inducible DNA-binding protein
MTERIDQSLTADELQEQLRDLLCLAVFGDHVRWVLTGDQAGGLADWLANATVQWRAWADHVAKHLVTLGVAPDGRVRSLAKDILVNWVPDGWLRPDEAGRLLAVRLASAAGWARHRRAKAATLPDTVHLLDAVSSGLEAQARAWGEMAFDSSAGDRAAVPAKMLRRRSR